MKHLTKPTLTAPTMDALAQYAEEVAAYNKEALKQVDAAHDYTFLAPSGTRNKLTGAERRIRDQKTFHDYAQEHPGVARAFRTANFASLGLR